MLFLPHIYAARLCFARFSESVSSDWTSGVAPDSLAGSKAARFHCRRSGIRASVEFSLSLSLHFRVHFMLILRAARDLLSERSVACGWRKRVSCRRMSVCRLSWARRLGKRNDFVPFGRSVVWHLFALSTFLKDSINSSVLSSWCAGRNGRTDGRGTHHGTEREGRNFNGPGHLRVFLRRVFSRCRPSQYRPPEWRELARDSVPREPRWVQL